MLIFFILKRILLKNEFNIKYWKKMWNPKIFCTNRNKGINNENGVKQKIIEMKKLEKNLKIIC